jgi:hypothetical protein
MVTTLYGHLSRSYHPGYLSFILPFRWILLLCIIGKGLAATLRTETNKDIHLSLSSRDKSIPQLQAWTVQKCYSLVRRSWYSSNGSLFPMHELANILEQGNASSSSSSSSSLSLYGRLDQFEEVVLPFSNMTNDFKRLVTFSPLPLTKLNLGWAKFNDAYWGNLRSALCHLETMSDSRLTSCRSWTGPIIHQMLCSMPNLTAIMDQVLFWDP